MIEEWREVVGWPTHDVSSLGRVRRRSSPKYGANYVMRPSANSSG